MFQNSNFQYQKVVNRYMKSKEEGRGGGGHLAYANKKKGNKNPKINILISK